MPFNAYTASQNYIAGVVLQKKAGTLFHLACSQIYDPEDFSTAVDNFISVDGSGETGWSNLWKKISISFKYN